MPVSDPDRELDEYLAAGPKADISKKTCMVVDNGLFVEIAARLSREYGRVMYYVPWADPFPRRNKLDIGKGVPGIERVNSMWQDFDKVDVFCFPDVCFWEDQLQLRSMGKPVFGAGKGELLEQDRLLCKEEMKKVGYPVSPYEVVHGMKALRKFLQEREDEGPWWVKVSLVRGSFETFKATKYDEIESKLDDMEHDLSGIKEDMDFILEKDLPDRVEIGIDAYCIDGVFPKRMLAGIEIKGDAFAGVVREHADFPEPLTRWDKLMAPTLKRYGYRGFLSTEVRFGKDHVPAMIDLCARCPSPPNESYQELYTNLGQIVWHGAHGVCINPTPSHRFCAQVQIHSEHADNNWQNVRFPEKFRRNIKLRNCMKREDGQWYIIPQKAGRLGVGSVIGLGDTLKAAIEQVKEVAESVKGYYIECASDKLEKAEEETEHIAKLGYPIFNAGQSSA